MGNYPTVRLHRQPNLVENITYFYRNLRDNSPTFIQNAPKIVQSSLQKHPNTRVQNAISA